MELYKEVKKNGSSRCVRAALLRFSALAPHIRPAKVSLPALLPSPPTLPSAGPTW